LASTFPVIVAHRLAFFFYILFKIVGLAGTFASRLDVARIRHSSGNAEARQHPTHQHNVYGEQCNKP
jgi:hypothetical protein